VNDAKVFTGEEDLRSDKGMRLHEKVLVALVVAG